MPVGGPLFGNAATGPGSTGGNKHLVEMRAGKMNLKGEINPQYHLNNSHKTLYRSHGLPRQT